MNNLSTTIKEISEPGLLVITTDKDYKNMLLNKCNAKPISLLTEVTTWERKVAVYGSQQEVYLLQVPKDKASSALKEKTYISDWAKLLYENSAKPLADSLTEND